MTFEFSVRLVTWNVNESDPPENINSLLNLNNQPLPGLYGIGLQELGGSVLVEDAYSKKITEVLNKRNFVKLDCIRLWGILLVLYIHRSHLPHVTNVETIYTRTGFAGLWGNKGGVSVRLDLYGVSVCITNCHLPPHLDQTENRINDFFTILDSQYFKDHDLNTGILDHDYVFWIGDLNFRIDEIPKREIEKRIQDGDLLHLQQYDQLRRTMKEEMMLVGFHEGPLNFPPTYKFDKNTDTYDTSEKQRKPAWCDRILWTVDPDAFVGIKLGAEQLSYKCHKEYKISDHKPVTADFTIKLLKESLPLPVQFMTIKTVKFGMHADCQYTVRPQLNVSSWDWIGIYKENFKDFTDYVTYIWASTATKKTTDEISSYKMKIDGSYLNLPEGNYYLCYFSNDRNCMVGISDVFQIVKAKTTGPQKTTKTDL